MTHIPEQVPERVLNAFDADKIEHTDTGEVQGKPRAYIHMMSAGVHRLRDVEDLDGVIAVSVHGSNKSLVNGGVKVSVAFREGWFA